MKTRIYNQIKGYFIVYVLILYCNVVHGNQATLSKSNFKEIIERYTFINDFTQKEERRDISSELFWKYQFKIPDEFFPIHIDIQLANKLFSATKGGGRTVEHLNSARIEFLNGNYVAAQKILIASRDKYGKTSPFHRRTDYFIGQTFLILGWQKLQQVHGDYENIEVKKYLHQAASFLSLALIKKADIEDEEIFKDASPSAFYNLAAIYYTYKRYAGSYGAASEGLNTIRKYGKSDFRSEFRRVVAESWIRNRSYLRAVQELDEAIRQDNDKLGVSSAFARVGDIYYDLNNYDLAEDAYALGNSIDREMQHISPRQLILRGESLFWLGRFAESQKIFRYGVESSSDPKSGKVPDDYYSLAMLRIADSYLALSADKNLKSVKEKEELLKNAIVSYFRVVTQYPKSEAAKIAKIRRACLELPYYNGNNVLHARKDLEEYVKLPLVPEAIELAWSCHVGSFAQRERTPQMLERIRTFSNKYPESRFLQSMVTPIIETQANTFRKLLEDNQKYLALEFFETNRERLFKKISDQMKKELFELYVDTNDSFKAVEFWPIYNKSRADLKDLIRAIVFATEMYDGTRQKADKENVKWEKLNISLHSEAIKMKSDKLPYDTLTKNLFDRVLQSSVSDKHIDWILPIAEYWGEQDAAISCEITLPLYDKIMNIDSNKNSQKISSKINQFLEGKMPKLIETDRNCALSLLGIEIKVHKSNLQSLGKKWIERDLWPIDQDLISIIWSISEDLANSGDQVAASRLWELIIKKGAPEFSEVKLAKMRLDPKRTEFESLWGK